MRNLLLAIFACGSLLQAGVVVPNGPWQSLNNPGVVDNKLSGVTAYWNSGPTDGGCSNIGCFVTKQGTHSSNVNAPNWDNAVWLKDDGNDGNGTAPKDFTFEGTTVSPITLLAEVAGNAPRNWFGWYNTSLSAGDFNTDNKGTAWDVIFTGGNSPVTNKPFSISGSFGFWFIPDINTITAPTTSVENVIANLNAGDVTFTQSTKNKPDATWKQQYFSLFAKDLPSANSGTDGFILGIEDLAKGDFDYNDMIVKFTVVPEPGFYGALSLGLAGLYLAVRRRKA